MAGAYPELEAAIPTTLDGDRRHQPGIGPLLLGGDARQARRGGRSPRPTSGRRPGIAGGGKAISLVMFEAAGLTDQAVYESYLAGAQANTKIHDLTTTEPTIGGAPGHRLDFLNGDSSFQRILVWPGRPAGPGAGDPGRRHGRRRHQRGRRRLPLTVRARHRGPCYRRGHELVGPPPGLGGGATRARARARPGAPAALLDDQRRRGRAALRPLVDAGDDDPRRADRLPRRAAVHPRASTRPATGRACGRCGCSPASAPPRTRTPASASSSTAGQTGLSIAYDMPTLYGYDTDDPEAEGEFGTCGVAVSQPGRHGGPARRPAARPDQHVDDDQLAGRPDLGDVHRRRREARRPAGRPRGHDSRTTSSRSSSPRRSTSSRPSRRCAS